MLECLYNYLLNVIWKTAKWMNVVIDICINKVIYFMLILIETNMYFVLPFYIIPKVFYLVTRILFTYENSTIKKIYCLIEELV